MFKPGDVVKLKSGGPDMTVGEITHSGMLTCYWFVDGNVVTYNFSSECLKKVDR